MLLFLTCMIVFVSKIACALELLFGCAACVWCGTETIGRLGAVALNTGLPSGEMQRCGCAR